MGSNQAGKRLTYEYHGTRHAGYSHQDGLWFCQLCRREMTEYQMFTSKCDGPRIYTVDVPNVPVGCE